MKQLSVSLLLVLTACASAAVQPEEDQAEPTPWKDDPKVLKCAPSTIGAGDTLVLTLGPGHGKELAIRNTMDGTWYFLVVGSPPDDMKSLMTPKQFEGAARVAIPADITGYAWAAHRNNERVFTAAGTYTVYASEILESEVGGYTCNVSFRRHAR